MASNINNWKLHDNYPQGVSYDRIVTRSQTGFNRVNMTQSTVHLFSDPEKFEIPDHPHLFIIMKGEHGSIPRTVITRSTGGNLKITKELDDSLEYYKMHKPDKHPEHETNPHAGFILADSSKHTPSSSSLTEPTRRKSSLFGSIKRKLSSSSSSTTPPTIPPFPPTTQPTPSPVAKRSKSNVPDVSIEKKGEDLSDMS